MKQDEISSTEKLLEQIRGNKLSGAVPSPPEALPSPPPDRQSRPHSFLQFRKTVQIGVDIGYDDLRLVKIVPSGANRHQIIDYRHVRFDPGLDAQHLLFPQFLRNTLARFIGSEENVSIWTTISSARLDTRLLRIPKVARRQIPNAVIWAYKKKSPHNDTEQIFDFEVRGETTAAETPQIEVLAYTIPRKEIDTVKSSFTRAGYTLDGVSTYPFLMQNLLRTRWKIIGQGNLCALYIGRNWSRIDIFNNGNLMLSRGIRAGMSSLVEAIRTDPRMGSDTVSEAIPAMDFRPTAAPSDLPHGANGVSPMAVLSRLVPGLSPESGQTSLDDPVAEIEPDDIFAMIQPAIDRLVRQVERTFSHYAINFEQQEIDRLCVAGTICGSEEVRRYLSDQLGIPLVELNPFEGETLSERPDTPQEQFAYIPSVGLASAGGTPTPNFLETYHDRAQREKRQLFNAVLFGFFLLAMFGLLGYNGWQKHRLLERHNHLIHLQQELKEFSPLLNPETVLVLGAKAKEATRRLTQYSDKYRGMAIIAELSRTTPADIRMTRIAIRLPRPVANAEDPPRRVLSMAAIIHGPRLDLEPALAAYMVQMKASPLFTAPRIVDKSFEMQDDREVLRFTAELEII